MQVSNKVKETVVCQSQYITLRDGIRLAVSIWMPEKGLPSPQARPAVLNTTRYWRAMALSDDQPEFQPFYSQAAWLWQQGYVFVVADARGSGASFGSREAEISPAEVADIGEIIDWLAEQSWCDGRVATTGTSYTANTTLHSLATGANALQLGVCRAADFDIYRHLMAPGGIVNSWFINNWGGSTAVQDANDIEALREAGNWISMGGAADNIDGVRPVHRDSDGQLLAAAVADHGANFNLAEVLKRLDFIDQAYLPSASGDTHYFASNAYFYQQAIEQNKVPVVLRSGWHDAATALGALSLFCTFSNPIRVILGPWNHVGDCRVDPFQAGDGRASQAIPAEDRLALVSDSLDAHFKNTPQSASTNSDPFTAVEYYTLGENRWKTTSKWPLPQTNMQRWYLSAEHQLRREKPSQPEGSDRHQVDPGTSTGVNNRWGCQLKYPVHFDDRRESDQQRLVYDSEPLSADTEITGHPVVTLFVRSSHSDGQFFAYLETVDADGRVRWLTDGQLRGIHRKVSKEAPPFKMFGPYHSLKQQDAEPLIPGEVAEISFDLLPISVLLKKGQRIRLAIAGADSDIFDPLPGCEAPELTLERNAVFASYIELPYIPNKE